jgi:S-adenosylmethionine synthetase
MARHIAKNIVAAGISKKCEIQIAYAIGVAQPVSIMIDLMGTGVVPKARVEEIVREVFDLRPAAIIEYLDLLQPIYRQTSAYGHFGREEDPGFTWEKTHMTDVLREKAGLS